MAGADADPVAVVIASGEAFHADDGHDVAESIDDRPAAVAGVDLGIGEDIRAVALVLVLEETTPRVIFRSKPS